MIRKKYILMILAVCLLLTPFSPAALAAEDPAAAAAEGLFERVAPLFGDGLDALTDWLEGQTGIAPELRETLRDADVAALFSDLKTLLGETAGMDDAALRAAIKAMAESHGVHLVDAQLDQLAALCRAAEKLSAEQLRERLDALRPAVKKAGGLRGVLDTVVKAITDAAGWIAEKLRGLF